MELAGSLVGRCSDQVRFGYRIALAGFHSLLGIFRAMATGALWEPLAMLATVVVFGTGRTLRQRVPGLIPSEHSSGGRVDRIGSPSIWMQPSHRPCFRDGSTRTMQTARDFLIYLAVFFD